MTGKNTPKQDKPMNASEVEALETEVAELKLGWQRTQADFDNFRRRALEDRATLSRQATADTLMELVPVFDNFQRAFTHVKDEHASWADGFRHIAKQMEGIFAEHGLTRIPTVGSPFDPNQHEAVSELPSADCPAGNVCEELESGWMLEGRVLKAAKVIVSTGADQVKDKNQSERSHYE